MSAVLSSPAVWTEQTAWASLIEEAAAPYRPSGRLSWQLARARIGRDPFFRAVLESGLIRPQSRVLDLGCGMGLLASLLGQVDVAAAKGRWPQRWPAPPTAVGYTGVELEQRRVQRAVAALHPALAERAHFVHADIRAVQLPPSDVVVLVDTLHRLDYRAQDALLGRVREALDPGGRLLLRVSDADQRGRHLVGLWLDRSIALARGQAMPPTWSRSLDGWLQPLRRLGFTVRIAPMHAGTPFAHVLLVADLLQRDEA